MTRYQTGHIYEAFNAFHVRYYTTEIIDGKPTRVQRSKRLCSKDDKYYSTTCKPVRLKCEEFMRDINAQTPGQATESDITVVDFWEKTYLPFAEENLRASTVYGYEQIWNQRLKEHFGQITLKEYRTPNGSQFLTGLTKTLGRRKLQHIRSLASGIFTVSVGLIDSNP